MTEIDSNVPVPTTEKKVAARGRKKKIVAKPSGAAELIAALKFIMPAQKAIGTPYQTHCIINNHWCVSFDEVLTIGCRVQEDISACPHSTSLLAALSKCGETLAITQLNESVLSIKSDKFKASINCTQPENMPLSAPDAPMVPADDSLKDALGKMTWLLLDNSTTAPFKGAIYLQSGTAVACNGIVLLEYWHGIDLPIGVMIPKDSAIAVANCPKKLVALGGSENSITFHFEDESFIKTQIFKDNYPNYKPIFDNIPDNVVPLPADFFEAIAAVQEFSESKFVYLRGNRIQSSPHDGIGASYEINGVPDQCSFNYEFLKGVQPHFANVTFDGPKVKFFNDRIRGVVMGGNNT